MKKPMEFSKKIMVVASITLAVVIIFAMIMIWRTNDLSPLSYLIPSISAVVSVGTGFYYSKAKVENRIKLMENYNVELTEDCFRED